MKQISFRHILSVSFIALASLAVAQDMQDQTDVQTPNSVDMVGMGGEFTYGVSFDAPAFRGLVPNIGLGYNSSNTSRASSSDVVGFGWSLCGFSMIERKSLGRGLPTFDNGQDLFILDGEPLMACDQPVTSNPWSGDYPTRYKTDRANASCTAGGNFSTRVESYKRIEFDETANTFTVTNKDGTQYLYESIGDLVGETGVPPLKWSSAMFRKTEETHGQQATEARRDCHEVAAS